MTEKELKAMNRAQLIEAVTGLIRDRKSVV